MVCPCTKNCTSRSGTCHATCSEYLEYEKKRTIAREAKMQRTSINHYFGDSKYATIEAVRRYRRV